MTTFSTWHCLCNMIPGVVERTLSPITHYIFTFLFKKNFWEFQWICESIQSWSWLPLAGVSVVMLEVGHVSLGVRGMIGHTIFKAPAKRKRKTFQILLQEKDQMPTLFIHFQFCCGPWGAILNLCSSHKLMTLWRHQKDPCWPASLPSFQWESFYSVTIMIWITYFWCAWERKEGWIKYDKTAILALVDNYSRILHVKM